MRRARLPRDDVALVRVQLSQPIRTHAAIAAALLLAIGAAIGWQLFANPPIGLADQGDSYRIGHYLGVVPPEGLSYDERYWNYFLPVWREDFSQTWPTGHPSSQLLWLKLALAFNRRLGAPPLFDLRFLGAMHLLTLLGIATALFASFPPGRPWALAAFGLAVAVVVTDVGYVSYLQSMYSEPASFLFLLALWATALLALRWPSRYWLIAWCLCAAGLIWAKPPNVLVAAPAGLFAIWYGAARRARLPGAAVAVLLMLVAAHRFTAVESGYGGRTAYNAFFVKILPHSPDPAADLREWGLPASYAKYAGLPGDAPGTPWQTEPQIQPQFSHARLGRFLLAHPFRVLPMLSMQSTKALTNRPVNLGNFPQSAGRPPNAKATSFGWWDLARATLHSPPWLFFTLLALGVAAPAALVWRWRAYPRRSGLMALQACLGIIAVLCFVTPALADGDPYARHQFLSTLAFDAGLLNALYSLLAWPALGGEAAVPPH